jgi:hypothetical protein
VLVQAVAHGEAAELIARGEKRYNNNDRMGALKLFEDALSKEPSVQERQRALFSSTCVHASFGDVELAQITLREAIACGLDFDQAMKDPELVKLKASPQILIQLRKFAGAASKIKAAVDAPAPAPRAAKTAKITDADLSDLLDTEMEKGMDTSIFGILRRVALLVLVAVVGGSALFFIGLKLAFPDYQ